MRHDSPCAPANPTANELAVGLARIEERIAALTDTVEKSIDNNEDAIKDLRQRVATLESSKVKQYAAMILIAAGVTQAPPWLASWLGM